MPTPTYIAYLRDSGGDTQDLSIPQQRTAIDAWAASNHALITHYYTDEARPGSTTIGRENFQAMMDHLRHPESSRALTGIIVWKMSRFSRDIDDAQYYKADLRRRGYKIISLNDNIPEGPEGRFFEAAIDWMNQRFLLDLSTDVRRGLQNLVATHGAIPGTPPRGFKRTPIHLTPRRDGTPHIVHRWDPDPELIPLIRKAFQMRSAGRSLAEINNATHLYTSLNSYKTFFNNPLYIGILHYSGQIYPNYCPPIIDPLTWQTVQTILHKNANNNRLTDITTLHPRRVHSTFLLSGIAHCAHCGSPLTGQSAKQRNGTYYQTYTCTASKRRRDHPFKPIPRLKLETAVLVTLRQNIFTKDFLNAIQLDHLNRQATLINDLDQQTHTLTTQLHTLKRQVAHLANAIAEAGHSKALLNKLNNLETQQTQIQTTLQQLDQQRNLPLPNLDPTQIQHLVTQMQKTLTLETEPEILRTILRSLIKTITIHQIDNTIEGQITIFTPPHLYPNKSPPAIIPTASITQPPLGAPLYTRSFTLTRKRPG